MTLADFTRPGLIVPNLASRDAGGAIHELTQALHREGILTDWLPFYHEALNREFLLSTEMEAGMAFPHARLPGLRQLAFAFGRSEVPFNWGPADGHPVQMVFLLAGPAGNCGDYLPLVSGLARFSGKPRLLEAVRAATEPSAVLAAFAQVGLPGGVGALPVDAR
jgi:mannitol/fructose-specific phosphotransferase system IIA component (Ntr-type)